MSNVCDGVALMKFKPRKTKEKNRQNLVDFCLANDYFIANTRFNKSPDRTCTNKETRTEGFQAPWTTDRFAQLDFILAPFEYKNAVVDVESGPSIAFNSDHAIVTATIRVKLKSQSTLTVEKYHKPSAEQLTVPLSSKL